MADGSLRDLPPADAPTDEILNRFLAYVSARGLDLYPAQEEAILELLGGLRARDGLTLVLVSHDIGVVQSLCDEVVVMKDGRVVEEGPTEKVLLEPQVAYTRRLLASIPVIDPGAG